MTQKLQMNLKIYVASSEWCYLGLILGRGWGGHVLQHPHQTNVQLLSFICRVLLKLKCFKMPFLTEKAFNNQILSYL